MDAKKVTKWMLLGLGTGVAAAYLAYLFENGAFVDEEKRARTEEADLLKTATT